MVVGIAIAVIVIVGCFLYGVGEAAVIDKFTRREEE